MERTPPTFDAAPLEGQLARVTGRPLTTVDLGKWLCGVALWQDTSLVRVAEVGAGEHGTPHTTPRGTALAVVMWAPYGTRWVVESPQSYPGHSAREEDLEALRAVAAEIEALTGDAVIRRRPWAWKGNVPKDIHHARLMWALSERERALVGALPRTRDAMDAVGLGLFVLGRVDRGAATIAQGA